MCYGVRLEHSIRYHCDINIPKSRGGFPSFLLGSDVDDDLAWDHLSADELPHPFHSRPPGPWPTLKRATRRPHDRLLKVLAKSQGGKCGKRIDGRQMYDVCFANK